jgi:hypothetical protein
MKTKHYVFKILRRRMYLTKLPTEIQMVSLIAADHVDLGSLPAIVAHLDDSKNHERMCNKQRAKATFDIRLYSS